MKPTALYFALAGTVLSAQAPAQPKPASLEDELLALLNTPVESASKRQQRSMDSPQAVEVITGAELRQMGVTRIQDALRLMTSVDLVEAGNGAVAVGLRGVMQDGQPRTLQVLVDGAPMYSVLGGGIDLSLLPVSIDVIDRIEVVRGPSSTLYGADAVVGVVSITTRKADLGLHGGARASAANLGTYRGGASVQYGGFTTSVTAGVDASSTRSTGQTLPLIGGQGAPVTYDDAFPDASHQQSGFARVETHLADSTLWASAGTGHKAFGPDIFPYRVLNDTLMQGGWRQAWSKDFTTEVRFHQIEQTQTGGPRPDLGARLGDPAFNSDYKWFDNRTTLVELQGNWTAAQGLHVVFGADQRKGEAYGPARFIGLLDATTTDRESGGFLSLDWELTPSLALSLGARAENETLGGSRTSPRAALVWKAGGNRVFRAAFLTSTRSPQIEEALVNFMNPTGMTVPVPGLGDLPLIYAIVPNSGLKPEKTVDYELGYRDQLGAVSIDVTLFHMKLKDLIFQANLEPTLGPGNAYVIQSTQFRNGGDATDQGVEASVNWLLATGWNVGLNGTWLDYRRDTADPSNPLDGGKGFSYAPKTRLNLFTRFKQGRFSGAASVQYVGATDVEALSTYGQPSFDHRDAYCQGHFNLGYEVVSGLTLGVYVRNAFRPFQPQGTTGADRPTTYYTAAREAGVSVRWSF